MSNIQCPISNKTFRICHLSFDIGSYFQPKADRPLAETFPKGFTLIELLISFAVIGILATLSTVSFISYNQSQSLTNAAKDIEQMLTVAKSRAQSQVKPADCNESALVGYVFRTCSSGADSSCKSSGDYEVVGICKGEGGNEEFLSIPTGGSAPKKLPSGVTFDPSSVGVSYQFIVLTGGVSDANDIILIGPNESKKTITVDMQGNIDEE